MIEKQQMIWSILFARFAEAAYFDGDVRLRPELEKALNEKRVNEAGTDTQVRLVRWNNDIVISFRGTSEPRDWWTDLKGKLIPNPSLPGSTHRGFTEAADSTYQTVTTYIRNHSIKETRLFLCGHSLGGALALLTAARLTNAPSLPWIAGVFTYGAPRVGDDRFATSYQASSAGPLTTMWVASGDPVPHVAPHSFGHRHAVRKQYTLKENAIGVTNLDTQIEIEKEEKSVFAGIALAGDLASRVKILSGYLAGMNAARHSMTNSYLKQLLHAAGQP